MFILALLPHLFRRTMTLYGLVNSPVQQVVFFRVQSRLLVVPTRILVALYIRRVLVCIQIDRSFSITYSTFCVECNLSYRTRSNLLPFVDNHGHKSFYPVYLAPPYPLGFAVIMSSPGTRDKLPIIDVAPLLNSDAENTELRVMTAKALHSACIEYGFFYLNIEAYVNPSEPEDLTLLARQFFSLSQAEKDQLSLKNQDHARGMWCCWGMNN